MFNWFYALIGVLIGMVAEPVGRAINHGPGAAPLWASSSNAKNVVSLIALGFIIFSATFGFTYFLYSIAEIVVGVFISAFLSRGKVN